MAKLTGPLMSLEARGSLGPGLTYSERKSGSQVRTQQKQVIPKPSYASTDNQSLYRLIIARWNSFTQEQQDTYNEEVKTENLQISGWNLFVKKAMLDPLVYLGLAGYWTFNREGSGTVLDISKNGNHGTLQPDYPANAPAYVDSDNIKMRKALSFDGVDDYLSIATAAELGLTSSSTVTLSSYFKTSESYDTVPCGLISDYDVDGPAKGFQLYMYNGGKITAANYLSAVNYREIESTSNYNDGKKHNAVAVFSGDGSDIKLYIDKISQGGSTLHGTVGSLGLSTLDIMIGTI